jgi:anti-sigma28 factor (negative regulator of flagellin synthesis)
MKAIATALIVSFAAVTGAHAADVSSSKTRAEVVTELNAAIANGTANVSGLEYPLALEQTNSKSREQVVAELRAAQANGTANVSGLEYPQAVAVQGQDQDVSRRQVQAELESFRAQSSERFIAA